MKIQAEIRNVKTLRSANTGLMKLSTWQELRGSRETSVKKPVQLIAGSDDIRLRIDTSSEKIEAVMLAVPSGRPTQGNFVHTNTTAIIKDTARLCGIYCVRVTNGKGKIEEWYVRFVRIALVPSDLFSKDDGDYELDRNGLNQVTISLSGTGKLETKAFILPVDGTRFDEVHVNFVQNLAEDPYFYGIYERVDTDGNIGRTGLHKEDQPVVSGPWLDCGYEEWTSSDEEARNCSDTQFPWAGRVDGEGAERQLRFSDNAGTVFHPFLTDGGDYLSPTAVPNQVYWRLRRIKGANAFTAAVAARTKDAPFTFIVFCLVRWHLTMDVAFNATTPLDDYMSRYDELAKISPDTIQKINVRLVEITSFPVPKRADSAGLELFGPMAVADGAEE